MLQLQIIKRLKSLEIYAEDVQGLQLLTLQTKRLLFVNKPAPRLVCCPLGLNTSEGCTSKSTDVLTGFFELSSVSHQ